MKYPVLKPITHLVCSNHFKEELNKIQDGHSDDLTEIELEAKMEVDPEMLQGDICPYYTTNRTEHCEQPKVCTICLIVFCVFTQFYYPLLRIYTMLLIISAYIHDLRFYLYHILYSPNPLCSNQLMQTIVMVYLLTQ